MTPICHSRVLLDTGPLVAVLDRSDQHHRLCVETLRQIQPPLWTTWPVLAEAAWLLRDQQRGLKRLYSGVDTGVFRIAQLDDSALGRIAQMQKRFSTLHPQLADLTLLLLAEEERYSAIFTLDRRDFVILQKKGRGKFVLLPEQWV